MFQPGLIIASQGAALSAAAPVAVNLIDNGTFVDSTGWTLTGNATVSGGAYGGGSGTSTAARNTNASITAGHYFKVAYDVTVAGDSGSSVDFSLGGGDISTSRIDPTVGSYVDYVIAGATQQFLVRISDSTKAPTIDNIVLTEVTLNLSAELIQNGTFDDTSNWSLSDPTITISAGALNWAAAPNLNSAINTPASAIEAGVWYLCIHTLVSRTSGNVKIAVGNTNGIARTAAGTYAQIIRAANTSAPKLVCGSNTTVVSDNVSVKKVVSSS